MDKLRRIEQGLTKILEVIVAALFFIILTTTVALVLLRYGFNSTIIGGDEAISYLFIYTTALGAAISMARREHINISFFVEKLPERLQKGIDSLGLGLVALLNGAMIWLGILWIKSVGSFESPVLRIPNRFIQASVPIGCSLVILYCLVHILLTIFEKKPLRQGGEL